MPITVRKTRQHFTTEEETLPFLVSDVSADVTTDEVSLQSLVLSNIDAVSTVVVTVADKQSVPVNICRIALDAGQVAPISFLGRACPGGISIQASVPNKVTAYFKWRK